MRSAPRVDNDNPFQRRAQEKEAQRAALFDPAVADPAEVAAYARQQLVENPQRIQVGKPLFAPRF